MAECWDLLEEAKVKLREYEGFFKQLQSIQNAQLASIIGYSNGVFTVVNSNEDIVRGLEDPSKPSQYKIGDIVWFVEGAIAGKAELPTIGVYRNVTKVHSDGRADVMVRDEVKTVVTNKFPKLAAGDKILLDPTNSVAYAIQVDKPVDYVAPLQNVPWTSIGGLQEAKKILQESIELPFKFPQLFKDYGYSPPKGVLLSGPPGCGKTMLGKAVATSLATNKGKSYESGFIYVKGPELLSMWVGQSEETIRTLFIRARKHFAEHKYPAVIFIDEADAILATRSSGNTLSSTIVPAFLTEMDGLEESKAIVLLATNRSDRLDSAVTREGRIDRKVRVSRPDKQTSLEIMKIYEANGVSQPITDLVFSDNFPLARLNTDKGEITVHLRDTVSGAMLAGIVSKAKSIALHRDIANKKSKASGTTLQDFVTATNQTYDETRHTRLDEVFVEVAEANSTKAQSYTMVN